MAKAPALVLGRLNWTTLEHRVVAMLVAQLRPGIEEGFRMQRLRISTLMDVAGTSSRDLYHRAAEVCHKLRTQTVAVRVPAADTDRSYRRLDCFAACRYVQNAGEIEAQFDDALAPYLLRPAGPADGRLSAGQGPVTYPLRPFMWLRSQHAMRIYELIKMREGTGHLCLPVEALRETLCCEHTYPRFSDFRRHVLERARTEIGATCDTAFTYLVERDGRTPVRVRFLVRPAEGTAALVPQRSAEAPDGTAVPPTSFPGRSARLRWAQARYDLYASVLARLPQATLDDLRRAEVRAALDAAGADATPLGPDTPVPDAARTVVEAAAARLRRGD